MTERFYITTPIYYVNAEPHIGHAYSTIAADVFSRFHHLCGMETFFLTGTDEHGDKIAAAAERAGQSPRAYADKVSQLFRDLWPKLNITHNDFIRTTEKRHQDVVKRILERVNERGDVYFSDYEGLYCYGCERFYAERELVEGKCPDHLTEPAVIKEANYFFRMSQYQDWLIDHIQKNPGFIRPQRYKNEVLSFLKEPLEDLCISRPKTRLDWGIPLPFDDNYVTYVWFDALINYVSAIGYPEGDNFNRFWPYAQHITAKDIIKPHGIYWPCMLKSAGIEPYKHLNVHGWWKVNEGKMSKTIGNVVRPLELVDVYGLDAFRYFLMRDMVFGLDSEFSEEGLVARTNADLANDLGNLMSRSLTMVQKYFKGVLPEPGASEEADEALKNQSLHLIDQYKTYMDELAFHKALMAIWETIGSVNKYIDSMAPWVLAKSDPDRLATVTFHIIEPLRIISTLIWPFMPETAEKIQAQLGLDKEPKERTLEDVKNWGKEKPVKPLVKAPALFPRIETKKPDDQVKDKKDKKVEKKKAATISFDTFQSMDLRIGTIVSAENIKGSKKLLKLRVDLGEERTVVAGIAGHYEAQQLEGKQVLIVANLEPVKLMGIESQGMILAAEDESGLCVLVPDGKVAPGTKVK